MDQIMNAYYCRILFEGPSGNEYDGIIRLDDDEDLVRIEPLNTQMAGVKLDAEDIIAIVAAACSGGLLVLSESDRSVIRGLLISRIPGME